MNFRVKNLLGFLLHPDPPSANACRFRSVRQEAADPSPSSGPEQKQSRWNQQPDGPARDAEGLPDWPSSLRWAGRVWAEPHLTVDGGTLRMRAREGTAQNQPPLSKPRKVGRRPPGPLPDFRYDVCSGWLLGGLGAVGELYTLQSSTCCPEFSPKGAEINRPVAMQRNLVGFFQEMGVPGIASLTLLGIPHISSSSRS